MTTDTAIDRGIPVAPGTGRAPAKSSRPVEIRVRAMGHDYDATPAWWFDNDPFLSLFFTAFSATLPVGEKQFIHSVRLFQDRVTDPVLREEIRAFIGQEAHHAKEHDTLNRRMAALGFSTDRIEKRMAAMFKWVRENQSPEQQLANTVCAEHFTAMMADYMLSKSPGLMEKMEPSMRRLWGWHAIEEAEHKAVAFDVYKALVDDTGRLRRTMVLISLSIAGHVTWDAIQLMREAGQLRNTKSWRRGLSQLFGPKGMFPAMAGEYFAFYRRDFHPWQIDNRAQLARWRRAYLDEPA